VLILQLRLHGRSTVTIQRHNIRLLLLLRRYLLLLRRRYLLLLKYLLLLRSNSTQLPPLSVIWCGHWLLEILRCPILILGIVVVRMMVGAILLGILLGHRMCVAVVVKLLEVNFSLSSRMPVGGRFCSVLFLCLPIAMRLVGNSRLNFVVYWGNRCWSSLWSCPIDHSEVLSCLSSIHWSSFRCALSHFFCNFLCWCLPLHIIKIH
jgi:hypothetical protein